MTRTQQSDETESILVSEPNWRKVAALSAKAAQQAARRLDVESFSRHMATMRLAERRLAETHS